MSKIEWTEKTWNPVTGCTKISPGCLNCYAARMAKRLKAMGQLKYRNGFEVTCHPKELSKPFKWKKPRMIFVCSMGDLFHEDVPDEFIMEIFAVMNKCQRHTFQVLTKRPARLLSEGLKNILWTDNIWLGVTVESSRQSERIDILKRVPAKTRFISFEPLLGDISPMALVQIHKKPGKIDWFIVGGESGPGAQPMDEEWVKRIYFYTRYKGVAFFFKQWGGVNKKKAGRLFLGREWNEMPKLTAP